MEKSDNLFIGLFFYCYFVGIKGLGIRGECGNWYEWFGIVVKKLIISRLYNKCENKSNKFVLHSFFFTTFVLSKKEI